MAGPNQFLVTTMARDVSLYRPDHLWVYNNKDKALFDGMEYIVYKGHKFTQHKVKAITPNKFKHIDFSDAEVGDMFLVEHRGQKYNGFKFFAQGFTTGNSLIWVENGNSFPLEHAKLVADAIGKPFKIKDPNKVNDDKKGTPKTSSGKRLGKGVQRGTYEYYRPGKI